MRAIDAIRAGVASCLCSDYQPSTMIAAAHAVASQTDLEPAAGRRAGDGQSGPRLRPDDRGRIAPGLRADLIAVARVGGQPLVSHTWSAGRLVFSTHYHPDSAHAPAVAVAA